MTNAYFNAQMNYLRDIFRHQTEAYSEQLNKNQTSHSSFEQLLEGFAYLTGELWRYVDGDLPSVNEILLSQLFPDFLKPVPSKTIIQFQPKADMFYKPIEIQKEHLLFSEFLDEKNKLMTCYFQTLNDINIYPLEVSGVCLKTENLHWDVLDLEITKTSSIELNLNHFTIFLDADDQMASYIYWLLLTQVQSVFVNFDQQPTEKHFLGTQACVTSEHPLSVDRVTSTSIFQKIKEVFCFQKQLFFIKISGFSSVCFPENFEKFHILVHCLNTISPPENLSKKMFKFNCTAAVNLYSLSAEPIVITQRDFEYRLIPDANQSESVYFYDLIEVSGIRHQDFNRQNYTCGFNEASGHFQVSSRKDKFNNRYYYLNFYDMDYFSESTISCLLKVSNGHYPHRYLAPYSRYESEQIPSPLSIMSLTKPSQYVEVPNQKNSQQNFVDCLSVSLISLCYSENLRKLLGICCWGDNKNVHHKIQAILNVQSETKPFMHKGVFYTLLDIVITLEEKVFFNKTEAYVFGDILKALFLEFVHINTLLQLTVILLPSLVQFTWEPIVGRKIML